MKITYIFHSGFLIETEKSYYIFDYYKGSLPALRPDKPAMVFASHNHADHYNPDIFPLLQSNGLTNILAVLAKDIPEKKYPEGVQVLKVHGHREYTLPNGERLETLISNDAGVAFLLTTDEGVIYHAGDLNDWTWEGESETFNKQIRGVYRHRIDSLRGRMIHIALLPLDPRQEQHYADGITYFLAALSPLSVYPMHYWEKPETIDRFLGEYPQYSAIIKHTEDYSPDKI